MKITKSQLKQIIKEEVHKVLFEEQDPSLEEGWKEAALAAAMGLSSLGAAPAAAAPADPPAQTQVMASTKSELVNKLIPFIGDKNRNWLDENYWNEEAVEKEALTAFAEVMIAVRDHWTSTVPDQWMGCERNAKTPECATVAKIKEKVTAELDPLMEEANEGQDLLYRVNDERRRLRPKERRLMKRLTKKLNAALDKWAPEDKSGESLKKTDIWKESGGGDTFDDGELEE